MTNPFVYNRPVEGRYFFNREKIAEKIINLTVGHSQGNVWITGERQVGKTSLLRYIYGNYQKYVDKTILFDTDKVYDVVFIHSNVQDCLTDDGFFGVLWQDLKNKFDFKIRKTKNLMLDFENVINDLYFNKKLYIVFLIDEFDAFIKTLAIDNPQKAYNFFNKMNRYLEKFPKINNNAFSCVFTANQTLKEVFEENNIPQAGSGINLQALELEWFDEKQFADLVLFLLKESDIKFTAKEIKTAFDIAKGYPYFSQKLLAIMFDEKINSDNKKDFIKTIKKEYAKEFANTIEAWNGPNMPKRTLNKLHTMMKDLKSDIKKINDKNNVEI
jgi:GTPase SAR1 family protein